MSVPCHFVASGGLAQRTYTYRIIYFHIRDTQRVIVPEAQD